MNQSGGPCVSPSDPVRVSRRFSRHPARCWCGASTTSLIHQGDIAMSQPLTELLPTVAVTQPQQAGALQVFGLRWTSGQPFHYTTLDEALAAETLDVTEVTEGGGVPTLKVVNKAEERVFLMAGEQLIGAKQNR